MQHFITSKLPSELKQIAHWNASWSIIHYRCWAFSCPASVYTYNCLTS